MTSLPRTEGEDATYTIKEEDDVKEIQASHLALGRESSTVQEEVGNYPDNLAKARQSHSTFKQMPNGVTTNPAHCPKKPMRQHLPLHPCANNYNQQHAGLGRDEEGLRLVKKNSLCECKDCSMKNEDVEENKTDKAH